MSTAVELGVARSRLYALLGALASAPTPDTIAVARELPALAALGDRDPDEIAADHHAAFSLDSASAVLSPDGLAGGPSPDTFGATLAALAALDVAARDPRRIAALLDRTLSWAPLFALSVRTTGEPAWSAVVEIAIELCAAHRAEIPLPRAAIGPTAAPIDLDVAETSLRSVGTALCRPAVSGWLPSGEAISRLAAAASVPGGFGDRAERVTGLLYASADAGRLAALCAAIISTLEEWATGLRAFERDLAIPLGAWADRAELTAVALTRMGKAAR